jgi:hypothetical protein
VGVQADRDGRLLLTSPGEGEGFGSTSVAEWLRIHLTDRVRSRQIASVAGMVITAQKAVLVVLLVAVLGPSAAHAVPLRTCRHT